MTAAAIPPTLAQLAVPIDGLKHYGKNPNKGDIERIKNSLKRHGQYKAIVVRAGTNEILAGNHTVKAARDLGWEEIAATFIDCDDDQAARIVLVDNATRDAAEYDKQALAELLSELPDLDGTGFTDDELGQILAGVEPEPEQAGTEADELPEAVPTVTRPGDVWELGPHRVVCGDSTSPLVLEELMGADRADVVWTDPPYGVEYVGKTADALTIENDGAADLDLLLLDAFTAAADVLRPGAPVYVAHSDTRRVTFETALERAGYRVRQNLVWVKNTIVLGHSDYQYKHEPILEAEAPAADGKAHEPILYGFAPGGTGRLGRGGPRWYGENNAATVFEYPKPPASKQHPTMKPVALVQAMLANSCRPGGIVLDLFGGSGSTLIAADYQKLNARIVELDPKYVDVICARYQEHSGELPTRGGQPHDFKAGE
jgi:DNA modification methylase